jgi:hypothetical protein
VAAEFRQAFRACGFWGVNGKKLTESQADFWVFGIIGLKRQEPEFVIVPRLELAKQLMAIYNLQNLCEAKKIKSYLTITDKGKCWDKRDLAVEDQRRIARDEYENPHRDFTQWLDNWGCLAKLLEPESEAVSTAGGSL